MKGLRVVMVGVVFSLLIYCAYGWKKDQLPDISWISSPFLRHLCNPKRHRSAYKSLFVDSSVENSTYLLENASSPYIVQLQSVGSSIIASALQTALHNISSHRIISSFQKFRLQWSSNSGNIIKNRGQGGLIDTLTKIMEKATYKNNSNSVWYIFDRNNFYRQLNNSMDPWHMALNTAFFKRRLLSKNNINISRSSKEGMTVY